MEIDKLITKFISKHHVMTIATVGGDGMPHTANLFYAYDVKRNLFIFTSSLSTLHGSIMSSNPNVAANIVLETNKVGCIEGLQIEGNVSLAQDNDSKLCYLKRFPFAIIADLELWTLTPAYFKMTDNKLGFGKKIIWNKE